MKTPTRLVTSLPPGMTDTILRHDFPSFVRAAFAEISPEIKLIWNPYLDLICSRLDAVAKGTIRRLIITMPPRHLKSVCVSTSLPAFFLGHNPSAEVMAVSYGQELSKTFAEDTRTVMSSAFYKRIFETRLAPGRQAIHAMKTTAGGIRRATSMDGAATGVGADLLIFDDPQKANEVQSAAARNAANETYRGTFVGRANSADSRTVIVMQRLHEEDFVGFVQGLGGVDWEVLNLPAIAEQDEAYAYSNVFGPQVYKRSEGAALHPGRLPIDELNAIRAEVGEATWATQYQQRPAPAGGGIVKTEWFKRYALADRPMTFERILQSWDTAITMAQWSDYSVCTTWGMKDDRIYLLNVFRQRLESPGLKLAIADQKRLYDPDEITIEEHTSSLGLIQDLQHAGMSKVRGRRPIGDKQMRMTNQASLISDGTVWIPEEAPWLAEYLHELAVFPNGKHDDQVDSTSQALDAIGNPRIASYGFLQLTRRELAASAAARGEVEVDEYMYPPGSMEYAAQQAAKGPPKLVMFEDREDGD